MKLKIAKSAMLNALQVVQGIVGLRSTLPILSNVLLSADKKQVTVTTTDLEVSIRSSLDAEVTKGGATTLPVKRLFSIIRELPAEEIVIDVDEKNAATITCGASFFKVIGLSDDEFPPLPNLSSGYVYTLGQGTLKSMLQKTSYSASADETRYVLNGVFLSWKGDKLTMVATDGRRLALAENDMEIPKEGEAEMIVPSKAVGELLRSLGDEGDVKIRTSPTQIAFEFGTITLISKLIEGNYPNFRQVIPAECQERVVMERETLLAAVRRVSILTNEKSNSVKMTFGKGKVKISAVTPDVGESHETMSVKYDGKEISLAFNPEFLMDPLRHLTSDQVYLEMTDDLSPGVLKADVPFLYVLMPMRVG